MLSKIRTLSTVSEAAIPLISRFDYLNYERGSTVRHEWVGGQMWMMTGGSGHHNRISGRLFAALLPVADTTGCRVYIADMKVVTDTFAYYPDVMVVCEPETANTHHEEHPCLIAEVLSRSTQDRDRREKWAAYKTIGSLRHYLLVKQDDTQVEHRFRSDESSPWQHEILGPDDAVLLTCPPTSVLVSDLYIGLNLESGD
jgi:Uma2 family endonuclease